METSQDSQSVPLPTYSSIEGNHLGTEPTFIPLAAGGPPYLSPLVRGQKIHSGPDVLTVTDSMVIQRERENQEIYREWLKSHERSFYYGQDDEYFAEFKNADIRRQFIRKVFFILFAQFFFTASYMSMFMFYLPAKHFILKYWWMWIIAMIAFVFSYCSISITDCGRRRTGCGVICLIILTLAESHLSAFVSVHFEVELVLIAVGMTAAVTILISTAATCFKSDFTRWGTFLTVLVIIGILGLIILIITLVITHVPILTTIFGIVGALVFSLYLYFDIQTIMGGKKIQISSNEVIFATTQLYVDIIGLYRYLLLAIGNTSRS